ncbi:hypothetical protein SJ059_29685, partial [Klebsiella aerogenes]|nr:hypothetical protein [Klebsiella aerogenes]
IVDGVQQGGVIVEASTFNETTKLGHWYGALKAEKDNYFSGKKYNSRGGYITLFELQAAPPLPMFTPLPQHPRLAELCSAFLRQPEIHS